MYWPQQWILVLEMLEVFCLWVKDTWLHFSGWEWFSLEDGEFSCVIRENNTIAHSKNTHQQGLASHPVRFYHLVVPPPSHVHRFFFYPNCSTDIPMAIPRLPKNKFPHLGMRVGGIGIHGTKTLELLGRGQFSPAFSSSLHSKNHWDLGILRPQCGNQRGLLSKMVV